jgi:hypothetical protein
MNCPPAEQMPDAILITTDDHISKLHVRRESAQWYVRMYEYVHTWKVAKRRGSRASVAGAEKRSPCTEYLNA